MRKVFVCSRYAGDTEANTIRAKAICRYVVDIGNVPFAPHLLFPQFMNEHGGDRYTGINLGLSYLEVCDMILVDTSQGISEGMSIEIAHAVLHNIEIVRIEADKFRRIADYMKVMK